jgi:hypothetical protein
MPWAPGARLPARSSEKGGDYILSVKGNQGRLHDETSDQFAFALRQLEPAKVDPQRWSLAQTTETGHDRSETRRIMVYHNLIQPEGPKHKSLPKRELRAAQDRAYLEKLLSLM